jgi:hypothetical protein
MEPDTQIPNGFLLHCKFWASKWDSLKSSIIRKEYVLKFSKINFYSSKALKNSIIARKILRIITKKAVRPANVGHDDAVAISTLQTSYRLLVISFHFFCTEDFSSRCKCSKRENLYPIRQGSVILAGTTCLWTKFKTMIYLQVRSQNRYNFDLFSANFLESAYYMSPEVCKIFLTRIFSGNCVNMQMISQYFLH